MKRQMTTDEQKIYKDLQHNSFVFLKDFIKRITDKDNAPDDQITNDLVMLSVSSLQISLELALKAVVLKKSGLVQIIKEQNTIKTIAELFQDFQNNSLKTKQFEEIKNYAKRNNLVVTLSEFDYDTITYFQRYRNGIVHFSYKFQEGDFFDLKYDITYFVVSILIKVLCSGDDDIKPSEFLEFSLGQAYHKKLIGYRPYVEAMQKMANEHSEKVFTCITCDNRTYAQDEQYCYCCNLYGDLHSFRDCEYCNEKKSMIYDGLNLEFNDFTTRALCLNCLKDATVFVCPKCEVSYNIDIYDGISKICSIEKCKQD